jgi:alpha-1,2-rhamnosyltransferase
VTTIAEVITKPLIREYIEEYSSNYNRILSREHEMLFLQQEARIHQLENILSPFFLVDTKGLTGISLYSAEFKNTLLKIIFPKYRKELVYNLGSRSKLNSLSNESIFQNSINFLNKLTFEPSLFDSDLEISRNNKVYIDVTRSILTNKITGIERVTLELAQACARYGAVPVITKDHQLIAIDPARNVPRVVEVRAGDAFLMSEGGWEEPHYVSTIMQMIRRAGGKNISLVHDIIALYMPELCYPGVPERIDNWFRNCVLQSDAIICVSETTAQDLIKHLKTEVKLSIKENLKIGWSLSGASALTPKRVIVQNNEMPFNSSKYYLSVGSIEPRKGYTIALDAFEKVWAAGFDATYVVVGRPGWNQEKLINRIYHHKEFNKRLYLLNDVDDNLLSTLYQNAYRLICCSIYEGFGLPIIEAAFHGLPCIVSDIPAFREIGKEEVIYFNVADHTQLADIIKKTFNEQTRQTNLSFLTWDQSALNTLSMIINSNYQIQNLGSL